MAHDYDTKDGAERRALERCKQKKGSDCQIVASFKNACAALAVAEDGSYGWAWRTRKAEAEQQAMKKCAEKGSGCKVYCWTCTGPSPSEGRPPDTVVVTARGCSTVSYGLQLLPSDKNRRLLPGSPNPKNRLC